MPRETTFLLPSDLFNALEKLAEAQQNSVSALVLMAVREHCTLNFQAEKPKI